MADGATIGIVGTITGFASVCVNGLEVHYDGRTPVTENGESSTAGRLAVGQVVSIEAVAAAGGLHARDMAIIDTLVGPVTHSHGHGKTIQVMGQTVNLGPDTRLATNGKALAPGQMVRVSGMVAADGQVHATRVQLDAGKHGASIAGALVVIGRSHATIAGVPVVGVNAGGNVIAKGIWNGQALVARTTRPDPAFRFAGKADLVVVEGLVQKPLHGGILTVAGVQAVVGGSTRVVGADPEVADTHVLLTGRLAASGILHAELIQAAGSAVTGRSDFSVIKNGSNEISRQGDRPEKVEKVEKPEKIEKPEKPERSGRS